MKKHLYLLTVIVAPLAGWAGYARGQRTNSMRQTWEYHVDFADPLPALARELGRPASIKEIAARNEIMINQRGAEGWELVAVTEGHFYFRRAR